jgi:small subunit ribosomal protein S17
MAEAKKTEAKAAPKKAAGADAASKDKGPKNTEANPKVRGRRKVRIGYVVSDKMQKTIVVELEDRVRHPLYGKIIRTTKKVKAHDENSTAGIGDRVSLMETRPTSATKRWRLVEILEKAK